MIQELDRKMLQLRAEMTRFVREGMDEDGTVLRRMLAELERLESLRSALRNQIAAYGDQLGGKHVGLTA